VIFTFVVKGNLILTGQVCSF